MSLVPMTALAAEGDNPSTWEELKTAISSTATGTITLGEDITAPSGSGETGIIKIDSNKEIILDLDGHTLTASLDVSGAKLTITNGTVKLPVTGGSLNATPVYVHGSDETSAAADYSLVNVESSATLEGTGGYGMIISGPQYASNASYGATINIKGTVNGPIFISGNMGNTAALDANANPTTVNVLDGADLNDTLCMNGAAIVNVYDGATITGDDAVAIKRGTLNVYGGTFEAVGEKVDPATANTSGSETTGSAISVTSTYNNANSSISVNIMGGTFISKNNAAVYVGHSSAGGTPKGYLGEIDVAIENGTFNGGNGVESVYIADKIDADTGIEGKKVVDNAITGGTFSSDVSEYVVEGMKYDNTTNKVIIDTETAVASVNGVGYTTLQEAVNVAEENGTIEILKDFTIETAVSINKDLTIDGNKNTITAKGAAFYIKDDLGSLNIYDLVLKGAELGENAVAGEGNDAASGPWMGIGTYNGCYGVTDLKLTNVTIDGFSYGLYFGQNPSGSEGMNMKPVSIIAEDLTIQNCYIKGAYFEKLTESTFTDCKFLNNGNNSDKVQENFRTWMCGVDLNLKGGTYQNITFDGCTFTGNGANNGTALHIKARDDGSYTGDKAATLNGVTVTGCTFENNNQPNQKDEPIILGEPGQNNKTPVNVSIQPDVAFTNNLAKEVEGAPVVVSFDSNGGTAVPSEIIAQGDYTLPAAPNRTGYYHFTGWSDGTTIYDAGETVTITADTTFTAVWSYTPPANPNYKITIGAMENGTVTANPTAAKAGATVTLTPVPDEGYALSTLTVTDRFGDAVRVTEQADGTYTFTMPNGQVTVNATFVETEEPVAEPFVDVAEGDWFYDAVVYAYQNELMDGVGGNRFAPNSETTRAQLVTILYRLEGQPAVSGDLPFTDVEAGIWYTDAILWAAQNNIVNGVSDTEFAPGDDLTRQQLVTILYRYAEAKGYDVSASADLSGYPDADQVQDYAQPAMAWAVAENIIQGMEDGTLKPAGNASRAQIATILMRFCEDVAQ